MNKLPTSKAEARAHLQRTARVTAPDPAADLGRNTGRNGSAQKSYDRYMALAQAKAQSGDEVAAENYYQHAEHFFRSMSGE